MIRDEHFLDCLLMYLEYVTKIRLLEVKLQARFEGRNLLLHVNVHVHDIVCKQSSSLVFVNKKCKEKTLPVFFYKITCGKQN